MSATSSRKPSTRSAPTWLYIVLVGGALLLVVRLALLQPFRVPSRSMEPTIAVGTYIVATKWTYGFSRYSFAPLDALLPHGRLFAHAPRRGDVVVFRPTQRPDADFVKRLIGLPGDRVRLVRGAVYINDRAVQRIPFGAMPDCARSDSETGGPTFRETLPNGVSYLTCDHGDEDFLETTTEFVVPPGHFFVLGDARDNSIDSRMPSVGYVAFENIIGPVYLTSTERR